MKQEIKEKLLRTLEIEAINEIIESEQFYFQKALDKYEDFMKMPNLDGEAAEKLLNRIIQLRDSNSFSNLSLLNEYEKESLEYKLLYVIAELVAYIDSHGFNKKEFNQYPDTRTIASAYVRQHVWVINLLKYKHNENVEELPGAIKNAIRYLIDPEKVINVLSERHRKLIGMFIFQNPNTLNFDELAAKEMAELSISVKNEKNRLLVYERIIYSDIIRSIWEYNQTIWKISHGNNGEFIEDEKEKYIIEKIVTVHKDTGKKQGHNFVNTMKEGDLFYLCYGGREIKLIGVITSEAEPLIADSEEDGWMKRSYEVIKESINKNRYTGVDKGWSPNHNSTCAAVKEDQLTVFEKELLIPYFDMSLDELLSNNTGEIIMKKPDSGNDSINEPADDYPIDTDNEGTKVFQDLNYILYGPPGTGKTYNTINYAVAMIENKEVEILQVEDYKNVKKRFESLKKLGQIVFTTFHQSYGYEEFIEGIKPRLSGNENENGDLSYYISKGVFKKICEEAEQNRSKNYVMIIDEINRGNISKIFGELITLIEKTKRQGNQEETKTKLPYSKKEFSVPANLYILGTMNTADRSIALLDTALRRRFEFIEMMPDTDIFKKLNNNEELIVEDISIKSMLDTINKRIEILYDREHTIGQAYFIDLIKDNSIEKLKSIFIHKIIPLLQEYFYEDYEKIRLVLGDNQVRNEELQFINVGDIPKNLFGRGFDNDIQEEKKVYSVNQAALTNTIAYIKIYNPKVGANEND